ncbi:MAG: hypothetical protein IT371_11760 [Deltaproteobacteria bacterium]|nr:hypothetical protein [Deltaproteobacteria bacterium]
MSRLGGCLALLLAGAACDGDPEGMRFPELGPHDGLSPLVERVGLAHALPWGEEGAARTERARQLALLRGLGVRHARMDFTWHALEKKAGEWDFRALDAVVEDAARAGVSLLGVAAYGNPAYPSASGSEPGTQLPLDAPPEVYFPPVDPAHYARYVATIAKRYAGRVPAYELWNEENIGFRFWRPKADAAAYARQTLAAARAGRAACPSCLFLLGGLSMPQPYPKLELYPPGPGYLGELYRAVPELNEALDAVAYHPYQYPKDPPEFETAAWPEKPQGSLATQTRQIAERVKSQSRAIPLWITENGWPTNPKVPETDEEVARIFGLELSLVKLARGFLGEPQFRKLVETIRGVSEQDQARYLVRSVLIGLVSGVHRAYLYTLLDFPVEPEINQEAAFGLFRPNGAEKPSARALRTLLTRFGSYRFVGEVTEALLLGADDRAVAFRDGNRLLLAFWRWKGAAGSVTLRLLPGQPTLYDLEGRALAAGGTPASVKVPLGPDVVWLEITPPL